MPSLDAPWSRTARAVLLASALCAAGAARADPPRAALTLAAGAQDPSLRAAVTELLDRLGVRAEFLAASEVDPAAVLSLGTRTDLLARVWIDLPTPDQARLFVVDASGERVLMRAVPLPRGLDEVARETLALVVADAVDALVHGAPFGVHRESLRPPPAPAPPPAAPPASPAAPRSRRWRAHLDTAVDLEHRGPALALGGAVRVGISWPVGGWRVGARVGARLRAAWSVDDATFALRTEELGARAVVFARAPLGARAALDLGLGVGLDAVRVTSFSATDPAWIPLPSPAFVAPVLRGEVALRVRLVGAMGLIVGAALEADLDANRYVARRGEMLTTALAPHAWRPAASLGVEAEF